MNCRVATTARERTAAQGSADFASRLLSILDHGKLQAFVLGLKLRLKTLPSRLIVVFTRFCRAKLRSA